MIQHDDLLQPLRNRGICFECKLRLIAQPGVFSEEHQSTLQQLKPLIIRQLAEEMLTHSLRQQLATMPGVTKAKVHMLTTGGIVTPDPSKCNKWTREESGYGWWYSSHFPPPNW